MVANRDNGYRVLMFSASWCGKCKDFKDLVDIRCVEHYDVDLDEAFASTYDIAMLPTFILELDGREQKRLVQPRDKATVYQWYQEITGEDLVNKDDDDDDNDRQ